MTDDRRSDPPRTDEGAAEGRESEDSGLFEKVLRDGRWKKRFETGFDSVVRDGRLKNLLGEIKLPREIVNHILSQVDDTKRAALKVIAGETREFLEKMNLADELAKLLTQVSLQVEVRFVPNDKAILRERRRGKRRERPDAGPATAGLEADRGSKPPAGSTPEGGGEGGEPAGS